MTFQSFKKVDERLKIRKAILGVFECSRLSNYKFVIRDLNSSFSDIVEGVKGSSPQYSLTVANNGCDPAGGGGGGGGGTSPSGSACSSGSAGNGVSSNAAGETATTL